jgi:hypothetical protein
MENKLTIKGVEGNKQIYMDCLNAILDNTMRDSFIDLGCNLAPHTPLLGFKERKYIDIINRKLDFENEQQYFSQENILNIDQSKKYNVSFALDVIEHLTVKDGKKLLGVMSNVSEKHILFTPLDDVFGMDFETDNPEAHRSLWSPEMVEEMFPGMYAFISMPDYHRSINGGAFFFWNNNGDDYKSIFATIKNIPWTKNKNTPSLGGSIMVYNAIEQDYHIRESVACLKAFCDEIVVCDCGSTDGTQFLVKEFFDDNTIVINCTNREWQKHNGREKLSFFSNLAASFLTTDYHFNLQADESVHEDSFPFIRKAIATGKDGFYVKRINLWGDSQHQLDVPLSRSPVGIQIIRLAKLGHLSIDDAESLFCQNPSNDFFNDILIYHAGFVRDNKKHLVKIRHIQDEVFQIPHDTRIDDMEKFDPWRFFSKEDVIPIQKPLPKFIKEWCKQRDKINSI